MGEPSFYCQPPSEGCCLNYPETVVVLVALIIVVQLGLKLAAVICYYLWYLVGVMFGMVVVQAPGKPRRTLSRAKRICAAAAARKKPSSLRWSEEEAPPPRRRPSSRPSRRESRSPSRRCLHCTLEPLKVTMNLQSRDAAAAGAPYRLGRRAYADYLPPPPPARYYAAYESEGRPRPRRAPSGHAVTRFRDAAAGSSDPLVGAAPERRRSPAAGTELVSRQHGHADAEHPGGPSRSRRPAKVYIYPVHPQTPPGSRSSSPERPRRSRRHQHHPRRRSRPRRAATSSREDQQAPPEPPPRRAREAEQQTDMPLHHRGGSTNLAQGQAPAEKPRYYWSDQLSGADWVYRPLK